jgi:hypothetical protein
MLLMLAIWNKCATFATHGQKIQHMEKKHNPFKCNPFHLVAAADIIRLTMNYVHFVDGYIYATDANIAIRVKAQSVLEPDLSKFLNGHSISRDTYAFLTKQDTISFDKKRKNELTFKKGFVIGSVKLEDYKFVNGESKGIHNGINKILENTMKNKPTENTCFGIDTNLLNTLAQSLSFKMGVSMTVVAPNKAIIVKSASEKNDDKIGLIMPMMIPA